MILKVCAELRVIGKIPRRRASLPLLTPLAAQALGGMQKIVEKKPEAVPNSLINYTSAGTSAGFFLDDFLHTTRRPPLKKI